MDIFEQDRAVHPLRLARLSEGWTQHRLADLVGVSQLEVGRWERGESLPQPLFRQKLCDIFDKTEEELGIQRPASKNSGLFKGVHFPLNEAPSTPEDFFGRERERRRLIERTRKKAATAIVGPRRIGKTWLIQYLGLVAPEQLGPLFRIGYIDPGSLINPTVTNFTMEALQQLGLPLTNTSPDLTDLRYGIRTLPAGHVPVLCIDKFETLVSRYTEFTDAFYQGLRSMASAIVLITITRKPLLELFASLYSSKEHETISLEEEDLTSPFSGIFEQLTLRPFNRSEAEQFIEKKGKAAEFGHGEMQYFWEYAKVENEHWSPVLLQGIGKILAEDRPHYNLKDPHYKTYFEQRFQEMRGGLGKL